MDFKLIVLFCCVALTRSAPLDDSKDAKILKYDYTNDGTGNYFFEYNTSDGQSRNERGELKSPESENPELVVSGSFSFTAADGKVYTVHYTADKDGFHPEGEHINVPPYTPWPTNVNINENDGQYNSNNVHPKTVYLPSTERAPTVKTQLTKNIIVSSSTPVPTNEYIPSSPSPKINDQYSELVSQTYIPSTVTPSFNSVTVSPINYIAAGSTPVAQISSPKSFGFKTVKSKSSLFEVIQNNHSSGGVFQEII